MKTNVMMNNMFASKEAGVPTSVPAVKPAKGVGNRAAGASGSADFMGVDKNDASQKVPQKSFAQSLSRASEKMTARSESMVEHAENAAGGEQSRGVREMATDETQSPASQQEDRQQTISDADAQQDSRDRAVAAQEEQTGVSSQGDDASDAQDDVQTPAEEEVSDAEHQQPKPDEQTDSVADEAGHDVQQSLKEQLAAQRASIEQAHNGKDDAAKKDAVEGAIGSGETGNRRRAVQGDAEQGRRVSITGVSSDATAGTDGETDSRGKRAAEAVTTKQELQDGARGRASAEEVNDADGSASEYALSGEASEANDGTLQSEDVVALGTAKDVKQHQQPEQRDVQVESAEASADTSRQSEQQGSQDDETQHDQRQQSFGVSVPAPDEHVDADVNDEELQAVKQQSEQSAAVRTDQPVQPAGEAAKDAAKKKDAVAEAKVTADSVQQEVAGDKQQSARSATELASAKLSEPGTPTTVKSGNSVLTGKSATDARIEQAAQRGINAAIKQGGGSVTIKLSPATLGNIRVEMRMDQGNVSVMLQADTEVAQRAIEQSMGALRQSLEKTGMKVDRVQVQLNPSAPAATQSAGQNNQSGQQQGNSAGSQQNNAQSQGDGSPQGESRGFGGDADDRNRRSFSDDTQQTDEQFTPFGLELDATA